MPTGIYDLDKILGQKGSGGGGTDDLDQFLRDERRRQIDEIKSLQVDEIKLKTQKRVEDLKKEVKTGIGSVTGISAQELAEVTQVITQLPEEQRPIAIQALSAFRQQSGGSGQMGTLAPLLMVSMLQQKPQTGIAELVTALKGLNDIQGGNSKTDNVALMMSMFQLMTDTSNLSHQSQMQMLRKEMEERNPYNPLQQTKDIMDIASGMGYKPGTGEENVDLAKYKLEHATLLQKSDHEFQLILKKMERDDDRVVALFQMLQPAIQSLSVAGASKMTGARAGGVQQVPCPSCGYTPIWITDDAPAICPHCKNQVITQVYEQKMQAQQQQQAQPQPPALQEEKRKPPAVGHVQV